MIWKENLANLLNSLPLKDVEIYARTSILPPTLSNMKNLKHTNLTVDQFVRLQLLFGETYLNFLVKIFGQNYFDNIVKIEYAPNLTGIGKIITKKYQYEVLPKKELVKSTGLTSGRIDYIMNAEDNSIKIEEITKIELALGEPIGGICKLRFSRIKLNSDSVYNRLLKEQRNKNSKKEN